MRIPNLQTRLAPCLLVLLTGCGEPVAPEAGKEDPPAPRPPDGHECPEPDQPVFLEGVETLETSRSIADHAWIRDGAGKHHLYAQSWNPEIRPPQPEFIRHFTVDDDLTSMQPAQHALHPSPGAWDEDGLWAPFILEDGGTYFMFYSGIAAGEPGTTRDDVQRIGLATSTDLIAWTKVPRRSCPGVTGDGCVYEARAAWTRWGLPYQPDDPSTYYASECRDPFVIRDRASARWLLFVVVSLNPESVPGPPSSGVAVAASVDLLAWTSLGYIAATKRLGADDGGVGAQQSGGIAENPFVAEHDGTFYLFFTDWKDPESSGEVVQSMLQYATARALAVDTAGSMRWVYRGFTPDPGVNAPEILRLGDAWVMSQSVANEHSGHIENKRRVRLRRILWSGDHELELVNYGPCTQP